MTSTPPVPAITFRPVTEDDLPLMFQWVSQPHVREFYQQQPITFDRLAAKHRPRIQGKEPMCQSLAMLEGKPFGYLQSYRLRDYRGYAFEIEQFTGISVDLYIGEKSCLGRGLGSQMLRSYVDTEAFPAWPGETCCYISHDVKNQQAIRASGRAGFTFVREVTQDGLPHHLLVRKREQASPLDSISENRHSWGTLTREPSHVHAAPIRPA